MKTACSSMHTPYAQCGSPLISYFFCRQLLFPLLWCCLIVIKGHIVYLYVTEKKRENIAFTIRGREVKQLGPCSAYSLQIFSLKSSSFSSLQCHCQLLDPLTDNWHQIYTISYLSYATLCSAAHVSTVWVTANKIVTSRGTVNEWGWALPSQLNRLVVHKDVLTTVIPFGLTKVL